MRRAAKLTVVCALSVLALAPAAQADLRVGVADDHPKISPELAGRFYDTMADIGLTENRITVQWDSTQPTTIPNLSAIQQAIDIATAHNVRITLAVYPDSPRAITGSPSAGLRFVQWVQLVAQAFPQVKDFIVGNEPNKARFWQPQYNQNGTAAACGRSYVPHTGSAPRFIARSTTLRSPDRPSASRSSGDAQRA